MRLLEKYGFNIVDESLITITGCSFVPVKADWLFFSSANGVKHYFFREKLLPKQRIAAIGSGTAKAVHDCGYKCDFIGNETTTREVALRFYDTYTPKSICFPCSSISMLSVQVALEHLCTCINIVVYETKAKEIKELNTNASLLIVTSPSNAEALSQLNVLEKPTIAIGPTTYNALQKLGFKQLYQAAEPTEEMLVNTVLSLNL